MADRCIAVRPSYFHSTSAKWDGWVSTSSNAAEFSRDFEADISGIVEVQPAEFFRRRGGEMGTPSSPTAIWVARLHFGGGWQFLRACGRVVSPCCDLTVAFLAHLPMILSVRRGYECS